MSLVVKTAFTTVVACTNGHGVSVKYMGDEWTRERVEIAAIVMCGGRVEQLKTDFPGNKCEACGSPLTFKIHAGDFDE